MVGRGRDPPGSVTRRTGCLRSLSDSLLEAAWSRQTPVIYVYSFMSIRHLGFFLIDLFSDYKTYRHHFSLGSRSYGFVAIISGIMLIS
jgi:hypothetical protein